MRDTKMYCNKCNKLIKKGILPTHVYIARKYTVDAQQSKRDRWYVSDKYHLCADCALGLEKKLEIPIPPKPL